MRQFELVEKVKAYDPRADEDAINRAYVFAMKAHGNQTRDNGDPYFSHPVEVAGILTGYRLDTASIVTALLHDTVEDTGVRLADIEGAFGAETARLVDGVTKLSRLELQSDRTKQAENFRKLVLAMSDDIRVLLVKLADRLHNMRTLRFVKDPARRRRIATETMEIYAPLAERIGIERVRAELEDLSFKELQPDAYASIQARVGFLRGQGESAIATITQDLQRLLAEHGIEAEVTGREKSPYSIWLKMHKRNVGFEQLSDIMAFRITVETREQCYAALGVVHQAFRVVPGRFKDYISTPKPNGYQSLHTGVILGDLAKAGSQKIEVQIRTREMQAVAENGVAAHWTYKDARRGDNAASRDMPHYKWLRSLLDILEEATGPEEFLANTKLEMFQDQVFCFTPKGDLISLPRGATPVDFAYAVHSEVGDTCVGCKVNGRIMPLRTPLRNGDQVEIITARGHTPSPAWERFVVTGRARARIRRFLHAQQRRQHIELGRGMLVKAFRQDGVDGSEKVLEAALKGLKHASVEDLYVAVGAGQMGAKDVVMACYPELRPTLRTSPVVPLPGSKFRPRPPGNLREGRAEGRGDGRGDAMPISGLVSGMSVHYAGCCHPLPGDAIVGIVTTGKGVTIHTADCPTLQSFAATPERFIDVAWEEGAWNGGSRNGEVHVGRIAIATANEPQALSALTNVIAKHDGAVASLKIVNRTPDFFDMLVDVEVRDLAHLAEIIAALRASQGVATVERARA